MSFSAECFCAALRAVPWPSKARAPSDLEVGMCAEGWRVQLAGSRHRVHCVDDNPERALQKCIAEWLRLVFLASGTSQEEIDRAVAFAQRRLTN